MAAMSAVIAVTAVAVWAPNARGDGTGPTAISSGTARGEKDTRNGWEGSPSANPTTISVPGRSLAFAPLRPVHCSIGFRSGASPLIPWRARLLPTWRTNRYRYVFRYRVLANLWTASANLAA